MSNITLFINYKSEKRDDVLLSLSSFKGNVREVTELLNIIIFRTRPIFIKDILEIDGVITVTNKVGEYVGQ